MPIDGFLVSARHRAVALGLAAVLWPVGAHAQATTPAARVPTIDELVELGSIGAATISPDGR